MTWLYSHHSSKENTKQAKSSKLLIFDQIEGDMSKDFHTHTNTHINTNRNYSCSNIPETLHNISILVTKLSQRRSFKETLVEQTVTGHHSSSKFQKTVHFKKLNFKK